MSIESKAGVLLGLFVLMLIAADVSGEQASLPPLAGKPQKTVEVPPKKNTAIAAQQDVSTNKQQAHTYKLHHQQQAHVDYIYDYHQHAHDRNEQQKEQTHVDYIYDRRHEQPPIDRAHHVDYHFHQHEEHQKVRQQKEQAHVDYHKRPRGGKEQTRVRSQHRKGKDQPDYIYP